MDQSFLRIILESHILKNKFILGQLYNGQRLETIGGKFLRVFIYRTVRPPLWTLALHFWLSAIKHTHTHCACHLSISWNIILIPCRLLVDYFCRLCALRIPVWSEAAKKEATGPCMSWRLCWNQQRKRCLRFWSKMEGSSKHKAVFVKQIVVLKCSVRLNLIFLDLSIKPTWSVPDRENAAVAICQSVLAVSLTGSSLLCLLQDLFVSDGSCWFDWSAETGRRLHTVRPKR